ncbi:MAG: hypothetical protein ACJAZ2_002149 [Glaciecola sp.]|jgi:hypothetical protein
MKNLFVLLVFCILSLNAISQGNVDYSIKVVNAAGSSLQGIKVKAIETTTLSITETVSNTDGVSTLNLVSGKEWKISIGKIEHCLMVKAVDYAFVDLEIVYIYDLEVHKRALTQDKFRSNEKFKIIKQTIPNDQEFKQGNCFLSVLLAHPNGGALNNLAVKLVNIKDSIVYQGVTNTNGKVNFIVPNKSNYEIDVENFKNYSYCDFKDEYAKQELSLEFAPTVANEKIINDTIHQYEGSSMQPSSERAFIKVQVRGGKKNGVGETVYLRERKNNKVYQAKADVNGYAFFLLPIHRIYLVDFNYEKDVDAINLMNAVPMTIGEMNVVYSPNPKLEYPERFIPTPDNLYVKEFNSFLTKQFKTPKDKPFVLRILSGRKINQNTQEALFKLSFSSSNTYGPGIRLPLNVAFVIDKSGSMYSGDRAESLKRSLWEIANSLSNEDNVSLILFDNEAVSVYEGSNMHLNGFENVIKNYAPGGGTNIYNGLELGAEKVIKNYDELKANRIILLTDGYGQTPPMQVTSFVMGQNAKGIEFSTIGLGQNYNQHLLNLIAKKGNGTFNFVDDSIKLSEVLLKEVKSSFNYLARDLKIEIFHNKKLVYSNMYGYPSERQSETSLTLNMVKVPAGLNQISFLKFKLDNPSKEIETQPLVVKYTYFDLSLNKEVSYQEKVKLEWTEETNTELLFDQEEQKLYAIAIMNQTLKTMAEAHAINDKVTAKQQLELGIKQVNEIFPNAKPKDVKRLFKELSKYLDLYKRMIKNEKD